MIFNTSRQGGKINKIVQWYNFRPYESRNHLIENKDLPHLRHTLERERHALPGVWSRVYLQTGAESRQES